MPSEEQEGDAIAVQRDTPISLQAEEISVFEENKLFDKTYQFEMCTTDVDIAFGTLVANYPNEDFKSDHFQRISIHKYLTSEMSKLEFFIAHNQWGDGFVHYPKDVPIRMRKGVISRFNNSTRSHDVYHMSCIDTDSCGYKAGGFSKALLTTEAKTVKDFIGMVTVNPELYFCKYCEGYMFDCVEHYVGKAWDIPPEDTWPTCSNILHSSAKLDDEETYVELFGEKVICIVYPLPQEPPKKKIKLADE
jgi:hypothetical protein